jgi:hypothetical protein
MNQQREANDAQVLYQGRWVSRAHFRVFVYNADGQKLANSYDEYSNLIESGLWFSSKEEIAPKQPVNIRSGRKAKNGSNS